MVTFEQALTSLEAELKEKGRSKYTVISYINDLQQLIEFLKKEGLSSMDAATIDVLNKYKNQMLNSGEYSVKSVSRKINSIRLLFRHLHLKGLISANTAGNLTHPKIESTAPRILSQTEYMAIRDASSFDAKLYSIVEILLQTGMRVGELVRLRKQDVIDEADKHYLYIQPYQSQPERKIPINEKAHKALQRWLQARPNINSDYIYITRNAKPIIVRNLRTSLLRVFKKAGVSNATVNDLRNTFIAYYMSKGVAKEKIAKLVGHKNLSTTVRYKNLIEKDQQGDTAGDLKALVL